MEIFDGYQLRQMVEAFEFDTKCSISPPEWYLTLGDKAIYLNWELPSKEMIDLFIEKGNSFSLDFWVGDLDLAEINFGIADYAPWVPFEMVDLWEFDKIMKRCEMWHVRCMLHVQDSPHTPKLFD
jgi:hypothetical protein